MRDSTRVCEVDGFGFHPGTPVLCLCASICVHVRLFRLHLFAALVGFYVPEILYVHTSVSFFFPQVAG